VQIVFAMIDGEKNLGELQHGWCKRLACRTGKCKRDA
jgi:hypothetical protein